MLTNDVLAVRLTSGEEALAVVLNVGDAAAEVRLPLPGAGVLAGTAELSGDGAVRVPPHAFALLGRGG